MQRVDTPTAIHLQDYKAPEFAIYSLELDFDLKDGGTIVSAIMDVEKLDSSASDLSLVGKNLELLSVKINGTALTKSHYVSNEQQLLLYDVPEKFTLYTQVKIFPEKNTELSGLYKSGSMYCTQCEAEGFRAITYFLDRPDVLTSYSVTLHADKKKYPVLLSNGNLVGDGIDGDRHWAKWEDPFKKPCYLFALVAGDLKYIEDDFVTCSGRKVKLRLYSEPENISKCDFAMESLKNAMRWDEEAYGREYDLDIYMIVAVNDFNAGAMENKGLNIFNTKYVLARPDTAVDQNYADIEGVIGHEYFHNWSGNRVTCRDWFQLSLKEGFTVFRDQQFSASMGSGGVTRIDDVDMLRTHQFAEDDGPLAHPVRPESYMEINNFYTTTIYNKGAEVIRMLYTLLGKETFRAACDRYFEKFDGQAVTCDDFVATMEEVGKIDLSQFKLWYSLAGTPQVKFDMAYDAKKKTLTLNLSQKTPDTPGQHSKPPMFIPISVGLLLDGDKPSEHVFEDGTKTKVLHFTERKQSFEIKNVASKPVPSLLRTFSAPIKIEYPYEADELSHLIVHDSDAFARWEAAQVYYRDNLQELVKAADKGDDLKLNKAFVKTFQSLLTSKGDGELIARLLRMPSQTYLLDQSAVYNVEGIHTAHRFMKSELARQSESQLLGEYERLKSKAPYKYASADVGKRALKNVILSYLMTLDGKHEKIGETQFRSANNMTDQLAALDGLANQNNKARQGYLQDFYNQWKHEALVVDKWFAVQATSDVPTVLSEIKGLVTKPPFKQTNPNNVYALIGGFFRGNPYYFHDKSGSGYQFLADQVIELDALNPQVGARMVSGLLRWKKLDSARQDLMRRELERILAKKNLSKNVYELAYKSLQS